MIKKDDIYISEYDYIDAVREYVQTLKNDKSEHTIISYLGSIDSLFSFINVDNINAIEEISATDIRKYQTYLRKTLQASSVNAKIRPLKTFFNWMVENEYIEDNPFFTIKKLKEAKKNKAYLTEYEIKSMFKSCKDLEEQVIFATLLYTGARRSELVGMKTEDIDNNKIKIVGKGNKERFVYLPDNATSLIRQYLETKKHGSSTWLFPSSRGSNYTPEAIRLKVKRIANRAGIEEDRVDDISCHTLRRTFITNLIDQNVNMAVIQNAAGHSDIATTMIYAKIKDTAVENAMVHQKDFFGDEI